MTTHSRRSTPLTDASSAPLDSARKLWSQGRHDDAILLYREAIRQQPRNVRAYVQTARAYAHLFRFEQMEQVHCKLVEQAPDHPGVHHYVGETYQLLKLPKRAIAAFELAASLPGTLPGTFVELARLYEQTHRLEEASELIERALAAEVEFPLASLVRARIQRRLDGEEKAEATLKSLIERLPQDNPWTCEAWGELALMQDRRGDSDEAMASIAHCKQVQLAHATPHWNTSLEAQRRLLELGKALSSADIERWRSEASEAAPRAALLTGFPRSGTTLLEQVLDAHPDLISCEERDFVGREVYRRVVGSPGRADLFESLDRLRSEQVANWRRDYLSSMEYLLGEPIGKRILLDKNPAYNLSIPLLLRLFPEVRLVVALRDPRDVVLSCYLRHLPLNTVSVHFLDLARTADKYAADMGAWLKLRDKLGGRLADRLQEVRYEDVVADLPTRAAGVLSSLGLAWDSRVLDYRERLTNQRNVNSPTYEAVLEPLHKRAIGRWQRYERALAPVIATLEPFLREFGYS